MKIEIYNFKKKCLEIEKIFGEGFVRSLYSPWLPRKIQSWIASRRVSQLYGSYQSTAFSRRAIERFVSTYQIPMEKFEKTEYGSFNEFFIRKFRAGAQPFPTSPKQLGAFAEGRYLLIPNIGRQSTLSVKNIRIGLKDLIGNAKLPFEAADVLIARLAPVDYHRFHFFDDGVIEKTFRVAGDYQSVNPIALKKNPNIFLENERQVSLLRTLNFGDALMIEVGAICVGKIMNHLDAGDSFRRGEEKGYFLFGGSTVIACFPVGTLSFDATLVANSERGVETLIELGVPLATLKVE